jgi:hypothetical protein
MEPSILLGLDDEIWMIIGKHIGSMYICPMQRASKRFAQLSKHVPTDTFFCYMEAEPKPRLPFLKWARDPYDHHRFCPWDTWTFSNAAMRGRLDILRWLLENWCPYNEWAFYRAAEFGHLEVLKWLETHIPHVRCFWNLHIALKRAKQGGHTHVVNYLNKAIQT